MLTARFVSRRAFGGAQIRAFTSTTPVSDQFDVTVIGKGFVGLDLVRGLKIIPSV